ncbi:TonB family protein [bacterium]|nr:MAG: TonB family protein [bacterium]
MKKIAALVIFLVLSLCSVSLFPLNALEDSAAEEIKLYIGETKVMPTSNPQKIIIGNPEIIDINRVSKDAISVIPKAPGKTTLILWDNFGEQSYKVKVFAEDIQAVKLRIDNLLSKLNLPGVYTQAEEDEGKVLLLGKVKTSQDRERITIVLGSLKKNIIDLIQVKEEEAVVEIEVQILELNKDATDTLGFTWPGALNIIEKGSPGISAAGTKWSTLFKVLNLQRGTATAADPFTFKLDMLAQEGKARILSRPRLACQSGKEAELLVGGEKPIFTTQVASAGGTGTNIEYKEYGIKLNIKPTVEEGERIKLGVKVEVSSVGTAETIGATDSPTAKAYPISKRNASTELFMENGQTLVIGGLIKQNEEEDIRKVPFLGDIPILGAAFRRKTKTTGGGTGQRGDTELFITLTPTIVSPLKEMPQDDSQKNKKTDGIVDDKEIKKGVVSSLKVEGLVMGVPISDASADPRGNYINVVQKKILENLVYPDSAKNAGFQGTVKLSLKISYSGKPLDIKVKESSGYKILDDEAVSAAKKIASFPPFPAAIKEEDILLDVPISYQFG